MPFKKKDNKTVWIPSDEEDIKAVHQEIFSQSNQINDELTEELRLKIDEAVEALVPGKGWGIIAQSNEKVYDTIKAITNSPRGLVDIIIPVYNSIHITKKCINAVLERTNWPFHIYIVDDASDEFTHDELCRISMGNKKNISLITNSKNRGFAATVNRGIKEGNGEFVVLLNSDVMVTPMWLTKMIMAHKSDSRNQIICPVTNNTAMVEVPMSQGGSYLQMNRIFERYAVRRYPEIMPTGFCFLFPRSLIDKIGHFDEAFVNFGEESSFWMQAVHYVDGDNFPRYRAVMADDTYVFHERGTSFSQLGSEAHWHMRKLASGRFNDIWPQFQGWQKSFSVKRALAHLRDQVPSSLLNSGDYHICWVVHSTAMCGGMKYIADIVNEINERGGNARVALIKRKRDSDISFIGELRTAPIIFEGYEDFISTFSGRVFRKGVVVAATAELVGAVKGVCDANKDLKPLLHVQSYEPAILEGDNKLELADQVKIAFKMIPDVVSNSDWITKTLKKELGVTPFTTIPPGVDQSLFYPRDRNKGDERPTVMISMIKSLACKGFDRGLALIQDIEDHAVDDIRILVYGAKSLPIKSSAICHGPIPQPRLANLLGTEADVFIDPASLHSYGLPALEAVASGVAVVSWDNKGIREYLGKDQIIFPNDTPTSTVAKKILELLSDKSTAIALAKKASRVLSKHNRDESVDQFIKVIEKKMSLRVKTRRIVMVVPHLRKHGGPTTMLAIANELAKKGHEVFITTVYSDVNPEVASYTDLPISIDPNNISKCDILITNSDNPMSNALVSLRQAKKKIMLKLSHNERFKQLEEQGLNIKWDAIVTSSNWLKDACENPTEGWNYKAVDATRIGWWHYSHSILSQNPQSRTYNDGKTEPINIGTLIHQHPLKGTPEIIRVLGKLFRKYGSVVKFVGIGEIPPGKFGCNLPAFRYKYSPNRQEMADILGACDIWVGASKTEGLGRMGLEAMSAGVACVLSETGAEYAKHESNCLIYPVGDEDAMYNQLERLILDRDLALRLANKGYMTARTAADPEECIDNLQKVIDRLF